MREPENGWIGILAESDDLPDAISRTSGFEGNSAEFELPTGRFRLDVSVQDEGMPRTLISDFSNLTWETCWWSGCLDQQRPVPTGMMLEHGLGVQSSWFLLKL